MGSNTFGNVFKITTWGESHGKAIGVVIDGCPSGLDICESDIQKELALRKPGTNPYTSPRSEVDQAHILSGVFEGKTTGAPICIKIENTDSDSSKYEPIKDLLRPGHANFTYLEKYGIFDYRGAGRASARETACRVAAGAIAKKLLRHNNIELVAYIKEIGGIATENSDFTNIHHFREKVRKSPIFCPDECAEKKMIDAIESVKKEGDSLGGIVEFIAIALPCGIGDPVYEKLEANLAKAFMSIPATKGFEIGSGFKSASMKGSEHNDEFITVGKRIITKTNHAGGVLGGISNGMPLVVRVAFKPTSSIMKVQETINQQGEKHEFRIPQGSRHDPCVALRGVQVVEAMGALVLIDALLSHRSISNFFNFNSIKKKSNAMIKKKIGKARAE